MKMSVHTCCYTHYFIRDLVEMIDYFADLGYQALDLQFVECYKGNTEGLLLKENEWLEPAKRIQDKLTERNLSFCQAHAPILGYDDKVTEEDKRVLRQCIKVCSFFGIKSLVVHLLHVRNCTRETFVSKNVEFFSEFFPLLDEYDVDFCFENYGYWNEKDCYCFSADQLLTVINAMPSTHIHACWDTGHGNLSRQNQYDSVVKLGKHLRAVHIHDNLYPLQSPDGLDLPDMHIIPLFGNVNFDAFVQGLIDIGYDNAFSFESDIPNRRGHVDFVRNGETQLKLKPIPFKIRQMADEIQAEVGKYILKTYGLWEGN